MPHVRTMDRHVINGVSDIIWLKVGCQHHCLVAPLWTGISNSMTWLVHCHTMCTPRVAITPFCRFWDAHSNHDFPKLGWTTCHAHLMPSASFCAKECHPSFYFKHTHTHSVKSNNNQPSESVVCVCLHRPACRTYLLNYYIIHLFIILLLNTDLSSIIK